MSEIALYNALTKLGLPPDEAKEAVVDVASNKEVTTKADLRVGLSELRADTKADITEIKTELKYLRWLIVIVVSIAVGVIKYF